MSENIIKNEVLNHDTTDPVGNYITQVKIGTTVYDIATHHGIKFRDGNNDATGVTWNGLSDLEIVIPNVADIVQTPVEFIGTVETDETVKSGGTVISTFEKGNLVFITENCTFGGETCEAGDMAIYDGSNWKVISGENQVNITGENNAQITNRKVVTIKGDSTDVLEVEGKALSLKLDYSDIVSHVDVGTTGGSTENVKSGKVTVSHVDLKLKSAASTDVVTSTSIKTASALKSGAVSFTTATDKTFVTDVTGGTLSGGKMPELLTNNEAKNLALGGSFTVSSILTDFVTSVGISEKLTQQEAGAFKLHDTLTPTTGGKQFVTGINNSDSFTVSYIKPENGVSDSFIKYVDGSYVTNVNTGAFKLGTEDANGKTVVVGLGTTTSTESGDVVTNVEINDNDTTDVFNGASVNDDHILEFSSTPVVKSVGSTITYKNLSTQTVAYTPTTVSTASFAEGKFITDDSTNTFKFDKSAETTYTLDGSWYKFNLGKGGYGVSGAHAIVPEKTFGVSLSEGSFPTISSIDVERNGSLAATVGTELNYNDAETIYTLKSNDVIKTYTLGYVDEGETADVSVGAAGTYNVNGATVDLQSYIKGVTLKSK